MPCPADPAGPAVDPCARSLLRSGTGRAGLPRCPPRPSIRWPIPPSSLRRLIFPGLLKQQVGRRSWAQRLAGSVERGVQQAWHVGLRPHGRMLTPAGSRLFPRPPGARRTVDFSAALPQSEANRGRPLACDAAARDPFGTHQAWPRPRCVGKGGRHRSPVGLPVSPIPGRGASGKVELTLPGGYSAAGRDTQAALARMKANQPAAAARTRQGGRDVRVVGIRMQPRRTECARPASNALRRTTACWGFCGSDGSWRRYGSAGKRRGI